MSKSVTGFFMILLINYDVKFLVFYFLANFNIVFRCIVLLQVSKKIKAGLFDYDLFGTHRYTYEYTDFSQNYF